ncbi:GntR family transcriptional regulator [Bounagaea algeriensis]
MHRQLGRRIAAEEFRAGLPSEQELQTQYGVSRHTVRQALRQLRAEGVITAQRGRGTRVVGEPGLEQPLGALYSLFNSVEDSGHEQRSVTLRLEEQADGVIAAQLGREESTPLLHVARLRLAAEEPLAVDRVWLPADLARPLLDVDFRHTSLYRELRQRCGLRVTAGDEQITAVMPSSAEREVLAVPDGAGAFRIHRFGCTSTHDHPIEYRSTLVRGDRFSFRAHWSPHEEYRISIASPQLMPDAPPHAN